MLPRGSPGGTPGYPGGTPGEPRGNPGAPRGTPGAPRGTPSGTRGARRFAPLLLVCTLALLAPLLPVVKNYGMANYIPVIHQDHTWATNWKLLNENFMEGYHLNKKHWITVLLTGQLSEEEIKDLIVHSYNLVVGNKEHVPTFSK